MNEYDDTTIDEGRDELTALARKLPAGIAPGRDLWPGIEAGISTVEQRRSFGWNRLLAQAAAVVLLVGGSSGITWFAMSAKMDTAPPAGEMQPMEVQTVSGNFGSNFHLGPEFMDARADVASRLERELERLPPDTRSEVRQNIVRIRAAINEINLALAEEPDNALLQELLLSTYREELDVMRRVEALASSGTYRTDI